MVAAIQFMASDLLGHVLHYCCRQPSAASFHYTQDSWCQPRFELGAFQIQVRSVTT